MRLGKKKNEAIDLVGEVKRGTNGRNSTDSSQKKMSWDTSFREEKPLRDTGQGQIDMLPYYEEEVIIRAKVDICCATIKNTVKKGRERADH